MGNKVVTVDMIDLKEAKKTFDAMGKLPGKIVTTAARRGATMTKKAVQRSGKFPVDTGFMKKALVATKERSRFRGKKVYDIRFDPTWNDEFQRTKRPIKNPGEMGGKSDHPYYPASMEYGFLTRSKGGGISYYPGHRFMASEGETMREPAKAAMAKKFNEAIQKEWTKRHGT